MNAILDTAGSFLLTAISFLAAMSVVIVIHELGHYLTARACGVRSDKFSFGFGPSLLSRRDRRGTVWSVSAIPLGGYVRFPSSGDAEGRPLNEASIPVRLLVVIAGPFANFVLSALVFAMVYMNQGAPSPDMTIGEVHAMPPGWANELEPGDKVVAINGSPVTTWEALMESGKEIPSVPEPSWTVLRDGDQVTVSGPHPNSSRISSLVPGFPADKAGIREGDVMVSVGDVPIRTVIESREALEKSGTDRTDITLWSAETGFRKVEVTPATRAMMTEDGLSDSVVIGVNVGMGPISPEISDLGISESVVRGVEKMTSVITGSFRGLSAIIFGSIGTCNLGGAITIAENSAYAVSEGGVTLLIWIATLSAAIGFFNLLPIPGLDGGHVVTFLYEALFRRTPSPQVIGNLAFVGTALIIGFMVLGIASDLIC